VPSSATGAPAGTDAAARITPSYRSDVRIAAALIAVQALVTKRILGEAWMAVVRGFL
jgi:hypothetical protein